MDEITLSLTSLHNNPLQFVQIIFTYKSMCLYPVLSFVEIDYLIRSGFYRILEHQLGFSQSIASHRTKRWSYPRDDGDVFSDRLASEPFG